MTQKEMKRIADIVNRFAPNLGQEMTHTLAYNFAQAFPNASFAYGRRKFIKHCGFITGLKKVDAQAMYEEINK
jgi:hypothetical protein